MRTVGLTAQQYIKLRPYLADGMAFHVGPDWDSPFLNSLFVIFHSFHNDQTLWWGKTRPNQTKIHDHPLATDEYGISSTWKHADAVHEGWP